MGIILPAIIFIAGIALLIKASDKAVGLAVRFSELTGMMRISVGMIIIGAMTSLPEFSIAMVSSFSDANKIMFSNLVGGSFTDLFFVMGVGAVLYGLKVSREDLERGIQIFLITTGLLIYGIIWGFDSVFGCLSILLFFLFAERLFSDGGGKKKGKWKDIKGGMALLAKIAAAVALIIVAAEMVTYSTKLISAELGVAESFLGATIIALSTTAPELFVTISAGKRNEFDLLVGNLFGSCFINIALILGLGAIIAPVVVGLTELVIVAALLGAYFTIYLFAAGKQIDRFQGIILLSMYVLYILVMVAIA